MLNIFKLIITIIQISISRIFSFFPRGYAYAKVPSNSTQFYRVNSQKNWQAKVNKWLLVGFIFCFTLCYFGFGENFALAEPPAGPTPAVVDLASAAQQLVKPFCAVINLLTGTVGKSIIVLILISLVIMLFLGKVSWGLALTFLFGIGLLFSAPKLVELLSNSGGSTIEEICKRGTGG